MKQIRKMLSRIMALTLVAVFFTAPSIARAATPKPVLIYDDANSRMWQYQPGPYNLKETIGVVLRDTTRSDGKFYVPEGHSFILGVYMQGFYDFRITITKDGLPGVYYTTVCRNEGGWSEIFYLDSGYYTFYVTAISSNIPIDHYHFTYFPDY